MLTLDLQVVVLGSGFSRSSDPIVDPLRHELQRLCLRMPEVRASTLGAESVSGTPAGSGCREVGTGLVWLSMRLMTRR